MKPANKIIASYSRVGQISLIDSKQGLEEENGGRRIVPEEVGRYYRRALGTKGGEIEGMWVEADSATLPQMTANGAQVGLGERKGNQLILTKEEVRL